MANYREVKRKAQVGDLIKVVEAFLPFGNYKNGDILTVKERYDMRTTAAKNSIGVRVIEAPIAYIQDREYVVLEPIESELDAKRAQLSQLQTEIAELERAARQKTPAQELAELEDYLRGPFNKDIRFKYRHEGNVVAASVVGITYHGIGIAVCAPDDEFDLTVGKLIALKRALGHTFDAAKYGKKSAPYEPKVGDIVKITANSNLHGFDIGQLVRLTDIFEAGFSFEAESLRNRGTYIVRISDFVKASGGDAA